jgi:hypothetical protein
VDTDSYRQRAQDFLSELERAYYQHYSGHSAELAIEPLYEQHAELFSAEAVGQLHRAGTKELEQFAVEGMIEASTRAQASEMARREAAGEITGQGETVPFRAVAVRQSNETDPSRRAALEAASHEFVELELNPLLQESLANSHQTCKSLGYQTYTDMWESLSGVDLTGLHAQTQAFLRDTEAAYRSIVEPQLQKMLGFGLEKLHRSDIPAFFRAASLDEAFSANRLIPSLDQTLSQLGIDVGSQSNVCLDTSDRPGKSPRAFCAPVRVPDEIYLVILPRGGRDDYETLLHEAGHAQHYAHVSPDLLFETRLLGDNSITESFAFLFQYLAADAAWLHRQLGVSHPEPIIEQARAVKLIFLRRYAAKLSYELELHSSRARWEELPNRYSDYLSEALHIDWPSATWLTDVDPYFYTARYLRAWALEAQLRLALCERYGTRWFERADAGSFLKELWSHGQSHSAEDLAGQLTGTELDFSALTEEFNPS